MPNQYRNADKFRDTSAIDTRLAELEQEKQRLTALKEELQKSRPTPRFTSSFSPEQKLAIFRSLFRGRTDIFANRWQNQQGRSGYSVACHNDWVQGICNKPRIKCLDCNHRQFSGLNDKIIYRHLAGQQVVGLYPLLHDNTCYLLATDFDKGSWQDEVKAMSRACTEYGVPHAVEISRSEKSPTYGYVDVALGCAEDFSITLASSMHIWPHPVLQDTFSFETSRRLLPYIRPVDAHLLSLALMNSAHLDLNRRSASKEPLHRSGSQDVGLTCLVINYSCGLATC